MTDLRPLEELPLVRLDIFATPVTDLTPLRAPVLSASLRELDIANLNVTDYSPVDACAKLEILKAYGNAALSDLTFLGGLKLRMLWLARTPASDISVLAGMPLTELYFDQTAVTDVSPLLQCPTLKRIILPTAAHDVGALRALPALERISYDFKGGSAHTAAEFWKEYDAKKQ